MQGKKHLTPQLFYHTSLETLVPQDNFYRRVKDELDFQFLYKAQGSIRAAKASRALTLTCNLKKYLKFNRKLPQAIVIGLQKPTEMLLAALFAVFYGLFAARNRYAKI